MAYFRILAVVIFTSFIAFSQEVSPAQAARIWAKITGRVIGSPIRLNGWVNFNLLTRKGKLTGKLNNGASCSGNSWMNITFSKGGGNGKCSNGLSAKFKFTITSRFPIRGKGKGKLADGRKVILKISPGE